MNPASDSDSIWASDKKRLLMVGNFFCSKLGTRSVCEDLAEQLGRNGWRPLTTSDKMNKLARLLDMVVTTVRHQREYDVAQVDIYSGPAFLWAEVVCQLLRTFGKRYVLTLHGGNLPAFSERWPKRVKHLLDSAFIVTTPSRYLHEKMRAYRVDLELLPNPLELQGFPFKLRAKPSTRLIWLRAFHNIYNPSLVPAVVSELTAQFPDIHVTMVGPDKGDGSLQKARQAAEELKVSSHVDFPGPVPRAKVAEWLNKGDIFLNTTDIDNTPVSVLEAMACGLIVISTNVGGIPYLVENEKDALLVPPRDAQAMANGVRRVLSEPGLAERLSANAHLTTRRFDWSLILPRWEDLLTRAARGSAQPNRSRVQEVCT